MTNCCILESIDERLSEESVHGSGHRISGYACWWIVLAYAFSFALVGCSKSTDDPSKMVEAELISIDSVAGEKVRLILKVTNVSNQNIVRAKALLTVLDADGNSLGTKSTYLIHSGKGGLAAGSSIEEDSFIEVSDNTKAVSMSYEMENIRFEK